MSCISHKIDKVKFTCFCKMFTTSPEIQLGRSPIKKVNFTLHIECKYIAQDYETIGNLTP